MEINFAPDLQGPLGHTVALDDASLHTARVIAGKRGNADREGVAVPRPP